MKLRSLFSAVACAVFGLVLWASPAQSQYEAGPARLDSGGGAAGGGAVYNIGSFGFVDGISGGGQVVNQSGFIAQVTAGAPGISLSGNGTVIASGDVTPSAADDTDFGAVSAASGTASRTFAISNTGTGSLTLTGSPKVALSGPAAADFAVSLDPASTVAPSGTTTFRITFDPASAGLRSATVSIASDDPAQGLFTFAIQGAGIGSGAIAFAADTARVHQGATSVDLTVVRTDGTAAGSVTINTSNGTLQKVPPFAPALAGSDYVGLSGAGTVVEFAAGELSKTVPVMLIPKTGTAVPNKRFTATLSGADLGAITTATIQILAADSTNPALTVTAPVAGTEAAPVPAVSATSPYTVKGAAGDAKGIARVEVVHNSGSPVPATLGTATAPTSVPWSLPIAPAEGANTVVVTAYDLRGNSTSITRSFNFTQRYLLSLGRVAPVGTAVDAAGTLALAATPAAAASALAPTAANSSPKTSMVLPGTPVKVTASPKAGFVFSHWTGLPGGAVPAGPVLNLTMPDSDVAGITAHFVANPFAGEAGAANIFYGLLQPQGVTPIGNATTGFFTGTLSPANGLFTGKVLIDGAAQSFSGYFYGDGYFLFTVGTAKQYKLTFGGRDLELYFGGGGITATVTAGSAVSLGTATRGYHSATRKVPGTLLNQSVPATAPAPNKGYFTVSLPAKAQDPVLAATAFPQGDGCAAITLSDSGTLSLSGVLADGTTITASSGIVTGGQAPILAQITTPGAAAAVKGGSLSGILTFDAGAPASDVSAVDLVWFRPAVTPVASPAAAAAATALYTGGWPDGIHVDAVGALYDKALTVQTTLGLPAPHAVNGNALLSLTGGKLTAEIRKTTFNITGNTVAKIPATDASYTLMLTPATGLFSGTFTPNWANPNTAKPAFKGVLLQKGTSKGGYGYFLSNAKPDADPESGRMTLSAQEAEE